MRATMTSTTILVDVSDPQGRTAQARVWEGVTEGGIHFTAYITQVQVRRGGEAEFNRDLVKSGKPSEETLDAIPLRYVL